MGILGHRLDDLVGGEHYRFPALMTDEELLEYMQENYEIHQIADMINVSTDSLSILKYFSAPLVISNWVSSLISRRYGRRYRLYESELLYRQQMRPQY